MAKLGRIEGTITDQSGNAREGIDTVAFDEDDVFGGNNDRLCSTRTDANGRFSMTYDRSKPWDNALGVAFRPDIYLQFHLDGRNLGKTPTREDWVQSKTLVEHYKTTVPLNDETEKSPASSFRPTSFGFHFNNQAGSFVVPTDAGNIRFDGGGFCGGMSAGAIAHYKRGKTSPKDKTFPAQGTRLWAALNACQLASLTPGAVTKLLSFVCAASVLTEDLGVGHTVLGKTNDEWWLARERLLADKPVILVLVRQYGLAHLGKNHQIVAYGYSWNKTSNVIDFSCYDCNAHDKTCVLTFDRAHRTISLARPGMTAWTDIRGFFVNPATDPAWSAWPS